MSSTHTGPVVYFGKLRCRGDFVRSAAGTALIQSIDQWMSQTMERLAEDSRWKLIYDAAQPVHFAIQSAQSAVGLVGHLAMSQDASGRRFPFVMAASFDAPEAAQLLPLSPLALQSVWASLDNLVRQALQASDFAQVQESLSPPPLPLEGRLDVLRERYAGFARGTSLERFEAMVSPAGADPVSMRQTLLALGLLLQPVLTQGHAGLNKGLLLPLPTDPVSLAPALTLWVDLVSRFFKRTQAEIALFVTRHGERPVLVMGFQGASAVTLRTVIDDGACRADNVSVTDAAWVEDWIEGDYGLRKLSNHLLAPSLSLAAAVDMFREIILGE
jgi:type VI secretion system protein ImpM